jgi:hypothetical protein
MRPRGTAMGDGERRWQQAAVGTLLRNLQGLQDGLYEVGIRPEQLR